MSLQNVYMEALLEVKSILKPGVKLIMQTIPNTLYFQIIQQGVELFVAKPQRMPGSERIR